MFAKNLEQTLQQVSRNEKALLQQLKVLAKRFFGAFKFFSYLINSNRFQK